VDRDETMRSTGVSRCASFPSVLALERKKKWNRKRKGETVACYMARRSMPTQLVRRQNVESQQNNSEAPLQPQDDIIAILPFRSSQERGSTTQAKTEKRAGWSRQTPATPLSRTADAARGR
jgi:hypothetical protein